MVVKQFSPSSPYLVPIRDSVRRLAIMDAIAGYPKSTPSAKDLLKKQLGPLGATAKVDAIEANTEGIFEAGKDRFEATGTAYVILFGVSSTDTFPVHVSGVVDPSNNTVKIDQLTIDTSSFFNTRSY